MFAWNAQFLMHWGQQGAAPNALPHAGPGGALKGASPGLGRGADPFFCIVLCWQSVKICECLLATPSFHCIGGGSVPPPITCQTLDRAARRKARCLALVEAPMQVFGVASCWQNVKICECFLKMRDFHCIGSGNVPPPLNWQTLGRAMRRKAHRLASAEGPLHFFGVVSCWQIVTFYEGFLEMPSVQCIGGASVPPPFSCRTLGQAACRKARRLALAEA